MFVVVADGYSTFVMECDCAGGSTAPPCGQLLYCQLLTGVLLHYGPMTSFRLLHVKLSLIDSLVVLMCMMLG